MGKRIKLTFWLIFGLVLGLSAYLLSFDVNHFGATDPVGILVIACDRDKVEATIISFEGKQIYYVVPEECPLYIGRMLNKAGGNGHGSIEKRGADEKTKEDRLKSIFNEKTGRSDYQIEKIQ
jgi:hypothetical protein